VNFIFTTNEGQRLHVDVAQVEFEVEGEHVAVNEHGMFKMKIEKMEIADVREHLYE
jgi:hypothetical protein